MLNYTMGREDGYNVSDTGNWNVAADYSKLKIMKPLDFADHYENIARFGYDTILEQLESFNVPTDVVKIIGFERLVNELLKLCGNAEFSMKASGTSKELAKIKDDLMKVRQVVPLLSKTVKKRSGNEVKIIPEKYYKLLDKVIELKNGLNVPLNKNDLIFTHKVEYDPKEHKKAIMENAKQRG